MKIPYTKRVEISIRSKRAQYRTSGCCFMLCKTQLTWKINGNNLIQRSKKAKNIWLLTPIFGTLIFVLLYFFATLYYPGGSQVDRHSIGFSWINNYWCNLLNETAINGQPNPAKPIALTGMFVLCMTLSFFWFIFPRQIYTSKTLRLTIQVSGVLAMAAAVFLFTDLNHDLVTNLASSFGAIATIGTFTGLYKNKFFGLFAFGLLNILLVGLNNLCYYNQELIVYLPVVQKISFVAFLFWICCISIKIFFKLELGWSTIIGRTYPGFHACHWAISIK